ncbi:MAG TPA: agmatine deiminase family protein [Clostridia bacterium]|nr:agmatine deiminase family protein [Clostridia bacterium]
MAQVRLHKEDTTDSSPALFPAGLGFRMPAEWEPMAATWLAWPHNRTDWPRKFEPIPYVYAEIVRHLSRAGRVELIVKDEAHEQSALGVLTKANVLPARGENVRCHRWPTNRGWLRDSGPIFVKRKDGEVAAVNWRFNAWAKYRNWQLDDQLPERAAELLGMRRFDPLFPVHGKSRRFVLEGGSIDVNGRGLLLTTEECLLSEVQQRNPGLSREEIELVLSRYLGIKKILWLGRGIVGDDTHGHVDDIARFVGPRTVVAAYEPDRSDPNFEPLHDNFRRLSKMTDTAGQRLEVVKLPMPAPVVFDGQRVPASYANFYIFNRVVLVPVFNDKNDRVALNTLAEVLPKHEIVPIYCGDLIWGLGAIHCMTQQQPK